MRAPRRSPGRSGPAWTALAARVRREERECAYCNVEVIYDVPIGHPQRGTVDHIIPLGQGGAPLARDNVCCACHRCNVAKGERTPEQWRAAQAADTRQAPSEDPLWTKV